VKRFAAAAALAASVLAAPALAQQPETGPKAEPQSAHPIRNPETGTRGPSGASPDTGPHGQRDVTKDAEPGKAKPQEELNKSGQTQPAPDKK
jgi:hypothetical protein